MYSEAKNSEITYSSGKGARVVTSAITDHTAGKLNKKAITITLEVTSFNFLLHTQQNKQKEHCWT
jgi:hypothetical protein